MLREYISKKGLTVMRIFSEKSDSVVALVRRRDDTNVILRMYAHHVPAYEAARHIHIPQLPEIYSIEQYNDYEIVEEEYIDGLPLSQILELSPTDISQCAAITAEVCTALIKLHESGIIHRDIKPENVIICSDGRVALIDLDASSKFDPDKEKDTQLLGTAGYAAPEQFGFGRSDLRTDLFSLGVMMNVMLTDQHPSRVLAEGTLRPIIEKCIEVNADKRYKSAYELRSILRRYIGPAVKCPECGYLSPGGGCLCCGKASGYAPKSGRKWLIPAVIISIIIVISALVIPALDLSGNNNLSSDITPTEELVDPSPVPSPTPILPSAEPDIQNEVCDAEDTIEDPIIAEYGGEFNHFGQWVPGENSKLSQTEVNEFNGGIHFDEYGNVIYFTGSNNMMEPFNHDLNGDGQAEVYYFSVVQSVESPLHFVPFDSSGPPFDENDWIQRKAMPVVLKKVSEGEFVPVKELTDMLQNAKVELFYVDLEYGLEGTDMPEVYLSPPYEDEWNNTVYIKYKLRSIGHFAVAATAQLNGLDLSGYCITQIRSN